MGFDIEARTKKAGEKIPLIVDFRTELVKYPGESLLATSEVKVYDEATQVETTTDMLDGSGISGTRLESVIQAGTAGKTYRVKFIGKTTTYQFEEIVPLIIESDFS